MLSAMQVSLFLYHLKKHIIMKNFLLTFSIFLFFTATVIAQDNIPAIYNFTGFTGAGFTPTPAAGQLDSDSWIVTGMSDGNGTFGGTHTAGDYARGNTAGGVTVGGVYSLNDGALWIQPIGADFTPGTIELKVCNNGGSTMANIQVKYDIVYLNDQGRANSLNFSWAKDVVEPTFTDVGSADFTSPETASGTPVIETVNRDIEITGVNLANGECLILRWTGDDVSGSESRDEMGLDNVEVLEAITLPVTLTSFEAKPTQQNSISLTWQTASEENNDYFSIEHSTDGTSFREIATQVGNGTTDIVQNYSFFHEDVANGLHYYRLKQVDFDGKFEYSNIVTAKISHSNDDVILTPNPTSNFILIQIKTPYQRDADFQILNMQGQVVLSSVLQAGDTDMELNIANFPIGIYYLQLFVDNDVITKKIIKQ